MRLRYSINIFVYYCYSTLQSPWRLTFGKVTMATMASKFSWLPQRFKKLFVVLKKILFLQDIVYFCNKNHYSVIMLSFCKYRGKTFSTKCIVQKGPVVLKTIMKAFQLIHLSRTKFLGRKLWIIQRRYSGKVRSEICQR